MANSMTPSAGQTINYGERLYQRGIKKREEREVMLRNARSEQLRQEVEDLNFEPQTNTKGYYRE